ncbi:MalY/PatB family protein [Lysobacter korlensis]|uniref:cysteine-S-conjugate beta-lyase n=1 Tax=Lysobacter korlensis TaxID=553636 RepID=A0ABV6RP87_9GAMM
MKVTADPLSDLRRRTSSKWTSHPPDVLPLFVAEMDYPLAPAIRAALIDLVERSDTGYVGSPGGLPSAFAGFAESRWNWRPDEAGIRTTTDVSVAIVETLRQVIAPGDRVVITPPVYPPFFEFVPEAGGAVHEVPLIDDGSGWSLDLDGLAEAFAGGATAFLLCNPHNPLGLVHPRETLLAVAELAETHGVVVVSDEIHGPLTHSTAEFTPFLSVSDSARSHAVAVTSASKAWNLAGLKCAMMIAGSPQLVAALDRMPAEVGYRTSLFGLHASVAAFRSSADWLDGAIAEIESSSALLARLLAELLPAVGYRPPSASYLAWLDFRAFELGPDPSAVILDRARVALNAGPTFGRQGVGHARLNLACSPEVLREAVERIAAQVPEQTSP